MTPVAATTPEIDAEAVAAELEDKGAGEAIEWMFETFGESHYIACSFQKTSSVTAHLASRINPEARFFYLDTEVLFEQTYETRDRLAEALGVEFDRFHDLTIAEQAARHGDELWKSDPDACCGLRKVEPMRRALRELAVGTWFAGLRRNQTESRAQIPFLEWSGGRWKVHPIAEWADRDVHRYLTKHHLPYHPLWEKGYVSIGDHHSTKPIHEVATLEETRFFGLKRECGIHEINLGDL